MASLDSRLSAPKHDCRSFRLDLVSACGSEDTESLEEPLDRCKSMAVRLGALASDDSVGVARFRREG